MQAGGCAHAWGALACVHACRFSGDAHVHARPRMHPPRIGSGGACRARGRGEGCGEKCACRAHACTRLHAAAGHARTRPCSMHLGSGCMSCACMRVGPFSHPCTQAHTLHLPHPPHARASSRPPAPQTPQPPTISTVSNLEARSMSLLGCARTAARQGSAPARAPAAPPETPAGVRCIIMLQALVPCGVCQACYSVGLSRVWLNAVGLLLLKQSRIGGMPQISAGHCQIPARPCACTTKACRSKPGRASGTSGLAHFASTDATAAATRSENQRRS